MAWKNLKIGSKLAVGFGLMLILIIVGGLVGYSGLRTVGHSLVVISDEQVPIVDASKDMKLALLQAMVSMEQFLDSTSVMASADESALDEIVSRYQIANKQFDDGVEAILNGGWMGANEVIKTDNTELAKTVREVAELHDKKYDATANELMEDGRLLLVSKTEEAATMLALEAVVERVVAGAANVKVSISDEVERRLHSDQVGTAGQAILREEFPLADMAMEMKYTIAQTRLLMEEYAQATELSELDQLEKEYRQLLTAFDEMAAAILKGGTVAEVEVIATKNPKIRTMVEKLVENHGQFEKAAEAMMAARRKLIAQSAGLGETMNRLDAAGSQAATLLTKVGRLAGAEMASARASGSRSSSLAIFWQIVVVGCSIVIGGLLGFIITRSLSRPIKQGVALADEIAKGDFSKRLELDQKDEIGQLTAALNGMADNLQKKAELAETIADGNLDVTVVLASEKDQLGLALKTMTDSLNEILGQVQEASEQIASGGGQVSDAAQSLSQGATEQASSLEEISASLHEMSSQTTTNAENANQANTLSDDAQQAAQKGGSQMQSMVAAMTEINEASQSISKIIKTIDEIAFQTNLLALNAAVEAARAGQHGKGFAVVAEEVRNLAARSARAAEETSALIEGSLEKTGNGSTIANQTAEALKGIVSGITNVSTLVHEISAASNEQAQGINQISQGVSQIDQVTQQNTAAAEQSAAAAEELFSQAEQMRQMLQRFTLKQGHKASTVSRVQPKIGWPTMKQDEQDTSSPKPQVALDDNNFGKY